MKDLHERIAIGALKPANATAARVMGKAHKGHELARVVKEVRSATPLPVRKWSRELANNLENFAGVTFGRLTVIGLSAEKPGRWVCRCVCGYYVMRTLKALRSPDNAPNIACDLCNWTNHLQRTARFQETGSYD